MGSLPPPLFSSLTIRDLTTVTPRKVSITDDNRGPIVNIINWLCIVTTILAVLTRVVLRLTTAKGVHKDDWAALAAMIFAIAHTATISSQVSHGLGRRQATLTSSQLENYQKTGYASELLFLLGLALSKISTTLLLHTLAAIKSWRLATQHFLTSLLLWSLISLFCIAFQCRPPQPWSILNLHNTCFHQRAFWGVFTAIDLLQELFLVITPILLVRNLHMAVTHKLVVIFAFSFRLLVMIFSLLRYTAYLGLHDGREDTTFAGVDYAVFSHVAVCVSITVSCVPFLKSVMENLQTGLIANHGQHGLWAQKGTGSSGANHGSGSYQMRAMKSGKGSCGASLPASQVAGQGPREVEAGKTVPSTATVKRVKPMLADDEVVCGGERLRICVEDRVEVTTIGEEEGGEGDEGDEESLSGSERRILGRGNRALVSGGGRM
ncbi:hypothetical protein EX30DRAFT_136415 [Ascodesmis nigricans]|uniref:Rhodopsin domain-containing protein n=1 Tax=Ascodesmis nigricans TaxID=341454 RepID=A0A4S2MNB1_9PEZI|nr:hypothetical protein EX30DRAFT_136415 [Ascodesmis nigricans]